LGRLKAECQNQPAYAPCALPIGLASASTSHDQHQETVINFHVPPDLSRLYARAATPTSLSVPFIIPRAFHTPATAQYKEQRDPQDAHTEFRRVLKQQQAAVPSQSPLPLASIRRAPIGRYSCDVCGKNYSQPQGTRRHQRETHKASMCIYCHQFEWGRRYRLREHLEKCHPDVDTKAALDEATRTRRRVRGTTNHRGDSLH
jgi:hypothetical protein